MSSLVSGVTDENTHMPHFASGVTAEITHICYILLEVLQKRLHYAIFCFMFYRRDYTCHILLQDLQKRLHMSYFVSGVT